MVEETQIKEVQSSYRSIFKATSLFGGVQVYQIVIQIIRSKFIAVILGPAGMGIQGLYFSATELVKSISSLGLAQSAVRDVSEANATGDINRVNRIINVLRRLVWFTGILGLTTVLLLSPLLSKWSFGNYDYTIPFAFLSVTLLVDQLSAGQKVVLQGLRRLKGLAKATALGSTMGLLITIPLYYFFKTDGIVPTFILYSIVNLLISWLFSRKVKVSKINIAHKEVFVEGKQMMSLGIAMSISAILATATSYILRSYIRSIGGTEEVGLYTAGFAIMTSYVGMIFNAMSTDYFPRLSAVQSNNNQCRELVNQQGEVATLIITPLLATCILFMPIAVQLLYSTRFIGVCGYLLWASLGTMFKLCAWLISFQFVAKSESKLFVVNEFVSCLYAFAGNILGYKYGGLTGVGIAYCISYFIYSIQVYLIARCRYGFSFTSIFVKLFLIQVLALVSLLVIALINIKWMLYTIGTGILFLSILFSLFELNKRMDLKSIITTKLK